MKLASEVDVFEVNEIAAGDACRDVASSTARRCDGHHRAVRVRARRPGGDEPCGRSHQDMATFRPGHSTALSTRVMKAGESLIPSALAVVRLTVSVKRVGRSIG